MRIKKGDTVDVYEWSGLKVLSCDKDFLTVDTHGYNKIPKRYPIHHVSACTTDSYSFYKMGFGIWLVTDRAKGVDVHVSGNTIHCAMKNIETRIFIEDIDDISEDKMGFYSPTGDMFFDANYMARKYLDQI